MWKEIFQFGKDLILLSKETQQNKEDIKKCEDKITSLEREYDSLRQDFNKLVLLVQKLNFDIHQVSEREKSEREKIILQLENEMLKFERRLPSGKDEK
jgi:predicted  nucleic acid-binding Zn-ribbon protein